MSITYIFNTQRRGGDRSHNVWVFFERDSALERELAEPEEQGMIRE